MNCTEIIEKLKEQGYFANPQIAYALMTAIRPGGVPLLIEGDPGVGKTSLAVATAAMLNIPLIRVSCHEGITADKVLYDYDYQKQLLVVSAIRDKLNKETQDMSLEESIREVSKNSAFYGTNFMLPRPVLQALTSPGRKVLLIDEIDKTDAEIEHALLEVLSDFSITIPEYGTVSCTEENRPIVMLTSNDYRQLSQPLLRRCSYLYIRNKNKEEIQAILESKVTSDSEFTGKVADCLVRLQSLDLRHPVTISEGIMWAQCLVDVFGCKTGDDIKRNIEHSVGLLAKTRADKEVVIRALNKIS